MKKHQEGRGHPPEQIIMSTHTRPQQLSVNSVSESKVTSRPVPVAEFGAFVSEHHANGDTKFRESYRVRTHHLMHKCLSIKGIQITINFDTEAKQW